MNLRRYGRYFLVCAAFGATLFSCSTLQPLAGGTSETTNGITATVRDTLGTPLAGAVIRLRPRNYLSDTSATIPNGGPITFADTVTDGSGRFMISGIDSGSYAIEVAAPYGIGALVTIQVHKKRLVDCGAVVARPTGRLYGVVDLSTLPKNTTVYIQVYGMERLVRADPATGSFIINNMPEGSYSLRIKPSYSSFQAQVIADKAVRSGAATGLGIVEFSPYKGWSHSRTITLNTAATGAAVNASVHGFPVLIRLTGAVFPFSEALPDGSDLRFTKRDGVPLPHEIESWDAAAKTAAVWVRMDTLYGNDSTQSMVMYWGNPSAQSESDGAAVFAVENGFCGVWHLSEEAPGRGTIGVYRDATRNGFDGADYIASTGREGIIGHGKNLSNRTTDTGIHECDKILLPASSHFVDGAASPFTISMWFKPGELKQDLNRLFTVMTDTISSRLVLGVYRGDSVSLCAYAKNPAPSYPVFATMQSDGWHHGAVSYGNGRWQLFIDGTLVDVDTMAVHGSGGTQSAIIGGFIECWSTEPGFDGAIDECRFEKTARSKEWIRLCYMNQRSDARLVQFK